MSIRPMSIKSVYPLAEVMAEQGYRVKAKAGTLLDDITKASFFPTNGVNIELDDLATTAHNLTTYPVKANSNEVGELVSLEEMIDEGVKTIHSSLLDDQVPGIVESIRKHLSFARNVVNPLIKEFAEELAEDLKIANANLNAGANFNIIPLTLPDFVNDLSYMDNFSKYINVNYSYNIGDYIPLDFLDSEEFSKLLLSDNEEVNNSLTAYISLLPNVAKDVRDYLFSNKESDITLESLLRNLNVYERFLFGQLTYNICLNLYNNPPEGLSGVSYSALKEKCLNLMDFAGSLMMRSYQAIQNNISSGSLVISNDPMSKSILVSGELYNEWLKGEDNSPEVLFGLNIRGGTPTIRELEDSKSSCLKEYNDYYNFTVAAQANKSLDTLKHLIVERFYLSLQKDQLSGGDSGIEIEDSYNGDHPEYKDILKQKVNDTVEALTLKDLDDLYLISLKLIAGCRFYYTSAFTILFSMYNNLHVNPSLSPMDASLLATIEYVGQYLSYMVNKED